jgi:hypothetical protein
MTLRAKSGEKTRRVEQDAKDLRAGLI